MLSLTKKTGYGLIAMTYLAKRPDGQVASAREIASLLGVPVALLMNVLKELAAAGYVESTRGSHGGYRLARRPEDVNLADVIGVLERPVRMSQCLGALPNDEECTLDVMSRCPLADPIHRVHRRLNDFLRKLTLAELIEQPAAAAT
jgi:Rrf2 family protein